MTHKDKEKVKDLIHKAAGDMLHSGVIQGKDFKSVKAILLKNFNALEEKAEEKADIIVV